MMNRLRISLVLAAVLLLPLPGFASDLTYGSPTGAQVTFASSGDLLTVTLTNNFADDPGRSKDILTGVFFNIVPRVELTPLTAKICATCSVTNGGAVGTGGSVGGEWAFNYQETLVWDDAYGISSVALGSLFRQSNLFGGTNLAGSAGPGGVEYGITTKSDGSANDDSTLAGIPLIRNQVIFTLSGLPANFDPSTEIQDINFQYGTSPRNVPEPISLALLGIGGATTWIARRRSRKTA